MFLGSNEAVAKPCKDVLAYPLQCFTEMFFATPAVVGTFVVTIGGFAVAVLIWGALLAATLLCIYYVLKKTLSAIVYFFHRTRVGQRILSVLPFKGCLKRICCCPAASSQPAKPIISSGASGQQSGGPEPSAVSKTSSDSKWFRASFRGLPFVKSSLSEAKSQGAQKTPQRSTSRISALTPKILSPRPKQLE